MTLCFSLQIFFLLTASALWAQTTLQDLPNEPASSLADAIKLSRNLEKLRKAGETNHESFVPFRPITALARRSQRRSPNDLIIGQSNPNEVVTITGSYALAGNLIIMNNGVLNLNNADFQIDGDLLIIGNGQLNATGGSLTVLQEYTYEHGAQVFEKGRLHFIGVNFSSNGHSWSLGMADSAQYLLENSKISDGFITTVFSGRAAGRLRNTKTPGEFLCLGGERCAISGLRFFGAVADAL